MMKKHIDESPIREQKLTVLEESNKNIIRSLATGDSNFKDLRASIESIDKNIVKIFKYISGI
jgi:DNA-binding HxlR family transcriptional regulator